MAKRRVVRDMTAMAEERVTVAVELEWQGIYLPLVLKPF